MRSPRARGCGARRSALVRGAEGWRDRRDPRAFREGAVALGPFEAVEVQTRDLVLVLVGHELVHATGVRLGHPGLRRAAELALMAQDLEDVCEIAGGVVVALVGAQVGGAALQQRA